MTLKKQRKPILEVRIHKVWNNPQEYINQSIVVHELEKTEREGEFIKLDLRNVKTGLSVDVQFHEDLLADMLREKDLTRELKEE